MSALKYKLIKSPVGELKLVSENHKLVAILWDKEKLNRVKLEKMYEDQNDSVILETEKQLNEYFYGKRKVFDLPLDMKGTLFQKSVWNQLLAIPFGVTCSYKDIAVKVGCPNGARAVGGAIGRNPISIIVSCHRVIASGGSLTGFAGGLESKKFLLKLESAI